MHARFTEDSHVITVSVGVNERQGELDTFGDGCPEGRQDPMINVIKLIRVHGGCLGVMRR